MPLSKFSQEQLIQLKEEFDSLSTIEEKFIFWPTRLNFEYSQVGVIVATNDIKDFWILTTSNEEHEELNHLVLDEYKMLVRRFKFKIDRSTIFDFDDEKNKLDAKLKDALNPLPILKKELEWIEAEVKKYESPPVRDENFYKNESKHIFWIHGYEGLYVNGKEPDLQSHVRSAPVLLALMNGYEVAKYRTYVEKKIWEVENKQSSPLQNDTPLKKQLLVLEYTGMLDKLNQLQNKDRNMLLAVLLNRSEQSIKLELTNLPKRSHVYKIRTEENYAFLLNLFEEIGLNDKAEEVKNELDKLKQIKK